ncbi:MAG: transcriptional regulator [Microthrixaceae bacterium]
MAEVGRLTVLHTLRLRSVASTEVVAARIGADHDEVRAELARVEARGWARHREGALTGWSLTSDGRREGERLLGEELRRRGVRAEVEGAYRDFLRLNGELLSICTDWQVRLVDGAQVVNDHGDPERDGRVLTRLSVLHGRARPLLDRLGVAWDRFEAYGPRLSSAHERIVAGETEWLTRPTIDSYHTVWFELHEDLLATLGRRRVDERHQSAEQEK